MPETRSMPQSPQFDGLDIAHERRTMSNMARLLPGNVGLTRPAAEALASDQRYRYFLRWVSPMQWMVAANRQSLTIEAIVDRILVSGIDGSLRRSMPGLTVEQWRTNVEQCYRRLVSDLELERDEEDAREQREPRQQPYAWQPPEKERAMTATEFSESKGMPNHTPTRPSQQPGARTERYRRQKAREAAEKRDA